MSTNFAAVGLFRQANELASHGQWQTAQAAYQQALTLDPDFAEAHNGLGIALLQLGDARNALDCFQRALTLRPSFHEAFQNFAELLLQLSENGYASTVVKDNLAMLSVIRQTKAAWPARIPPERLIGSPDFSEVLKNPYLLFYLGIVRLRDAEIEQLLTNLRFALLRFADQPEVEPYVLSFICALARQCFTNEYVFSLTAEESPLVDELRRKIEAEIASGVVPPPHRLGILACYTPLNSLPDTSSIRAKTWSPVFQALVIQQIQEPGQEREIRARIPVLTTIDDEISIKVRNQYEENPYPRWSVGPTPGRKINFKEYLSTFFPQVKSRSFRKNVDILVAGCGTGAVVVNFLQLLDNAKVLGVDLSLASLSYGKRMAEVLRLDNAEFGQADILKLPELGRSFDVITSTGVMHHMADPFEAWRRLVSTLRPGGYMHVGLYSEVARKGITEGWEFIKKGGYGKSADEIRRFRQDILALPDGAPMKSASQSPDFYSLSECRDLYFHEHELRVTIPQIKKFLSENGLEFIGWNLHAELVKQYKSEFPKDPFATNLDNWWRFEKKHPNTFAKMYIFWMQKTA